jgi:hypothetical protein
VVRYRTDNSFESVYKNTPQNWSIALCANELLNVRESHFNWRLG